MASNVYLMEAVNLFCGDHDPNDSNHLTLDELKLPDLETATIEHTPGGSIMGVNFATTMMNALVATFRLRGFDPERLKLFGFGSRERRNFTAYGVIREKRKNEQIPAIAVIEGVITALRPTAFRRPDGTDHDFEINELVSYRLTVKGEPVFEFDYFTNTWRIGGISEVDRMNSILRIPGSGR